MTVKQWLDTLPEIQFLRGGYEKIVNYKACQNLLPHTLNLYKIKYVDNKILLAILPKIRHNNIIKELGFKKAVGGYYIRKDRAGYSFLTILGEE